MSKQAVTRKINPQYEHVAPIRQKTGPLWRLAVYSADLRERETWRRFETLGDAEAALAWVLVKCALPRESMVWCIEHSADGSGERKWRRV